MRVLPPPNVTGALHIGHPLTAAIQLMDRMFDEFANLWMKMKIQVRQILGPFRLVHRHRRRRKTFDRNNKDCSNVRSQVEDKSNNCENQKGEESIIRCSSTSSVESNSSSLNMLSDRVARQRVSDEIEGTSGWKLSNCPWNLQVIARSPRSLTRFMPDDIPGVTSPMVYIGMLFSWFAWHVEDHELHNLNFLHIVSPKTWYAVPGDYAFTFEEVIRSKAYGGGVDRSVSLTLLGEKTILLFHACRLVQNPGEFVVTFPRAYHIGFSHGFNCGEAANFGTPKWLSVAKEAAVRRAAMNFLPMLSHQQLLYLLTMTFIPRRARNLSKVPRSLLPGIRSSRLKDRQKEERELLVKTEFIEYILKENKLLTCILNRSSSYHAVVWDLESLSPSVINNSTIINPQTENFHVEKDNEKLVHVEDEDMSSHFQIDSGTLPRIFCLEHASKVEELLDSIGGAKLLIICHSVHGAMAGFSSFTVGPFNSRHVYIPIQALSALQFLLNRVRNLQETVSKLDLILMLARGWMEWISISVKIFSLPDLNLITEEHLGGEIIPRSVLLCAFEGLLCALGDGHLLNFLLNTSTWELTDRKKVSLRKELRMLSQAARDAGALREGKDKLEK
ncbi:unnamed protein product [Lactuca virosa]|uniref:JmjC domain-containing protein n=1 Tax=Lactuca virosa TaxID=75947 RepID=A0AAU9P7K3_9ASTR|nr:unnamed protein product [Lactuca virosa]